ncbi:MAG TPA: sulfate permease [Termitinemataceae bacterium]|nr:sulfate permease [Termitinemataceae bacterium]HOM24177.1 sulfate permease [Termitinemataceae bacterium]HPQ01158.1 sulfate permease [Termitinemataceae bacterium]
MNLNSFLKEKGEFVPRTFEIGKAFPYSRENLVKDLIAGLTVGIVALPLAMAFSIAAGGSPAQGLYTAIFAGFFISLLGGSRYQIAGPTGAFVVIIYGVISRQGMEGLIVATLLAGLMLIVMGLSGLGRLIKFIPYPVTTGFTTGIALLIFSQQVKDFLGLSIEKVSPEFFEKWVQYIENIGSFNPLTLTVGMGTILIIVGIRRFFPRIPASVVGVTIATLVCVIFRLPVETIGSRFGAIPASLPLPHIPSFQWATLRAVFPDAVTIALLAAIESLLSAVVADGMTGDRHKANMELVAQGVGNIASALFGGIPATGAIARTATNIKSGAQSPIAGMVHALTLLLFVLFLAPLASVIPLVSLSAVLMVVAWDMSELHRFVSIIRKSPRSDMIVLLTTFALTVLIDLTVAVEVGVVLAAFLFLRRMVETAEIRPGSPDIGSELVYGPNNEHPHELPRHAKDIEIYEITGPFFFGVADILQDTLMTLEKKPRVFILQLAQVPAIDSTGIAALESFLRYCKKHHISLLLCEIREQPRRALEKAGFIQELGEEYLCSTLDEALKKAEAQKKTRRHKLGTLR